MEAVRISTTIRSLSNEEKVNRLRKAEEQKRMPSLFLRQKHIG